MTAKSMKPYVLHDTKAQSKQVDSVYTIENYFLV